MEDIKIDKRWRYSNRVNHSEDMPGKIEPMLAGEYRIKVCCPNCQQGTDLFIKKGTAVRDIINDVCCPNCGVTRRK